MAANATYSVSRVRGDLRSSLGSRTTGSVDTTTQEFGRSVFAFPQGGSDTTYSPTFPINFDLPRLSITSWNDATVTCEITLTLQYSFNGNTWYDVPEAIYKTVIPNGTKGTKTNHLHTSMLKGAIFRFKHDTKGATPAMGGTIFINTRQYNTNTN